MSTTARTRHEMPFTRIELVVLSLVDGKLKVLLGKRVQDPYAGRWALPGGVLRIDLDANLEAAVQRTARERLNAELPFIRQLVTVGSRDRDRDRAPWALAIVYRALLPIESFNPVASFVRTLGCSLAGIGRLEDGPPPQRLGHLIARFGRAHAGQQLVVDRPSLVQKLGQRRRLGGVLGLQVEARRIGLDRRGSGQRAAAMRH